MISRRSLMLGVCATPVLGADNDLTLLTLAEASDRVRKKTISPVELVQASLRRIERLNPLLNAYITVTAEAALIRARELEAEAQQGRWRSPLHGIPVALKDLIDTAGVRTTAASAIFADRIPSEDAEVVRRLKPAGAVILGKLNMHEFAYGDTSAQSHYGPVRNPSNREYVPGGHREVQPPLSPRDSAMARWDRIRAARSANPRRTAASWA